MKRSVYLLAGLFLVLVGSLSAQDIDAHVEMLEANGRYAEALALFLRGADTSPVAQYFIGDYYYHGRRGVVRDTDKGKTYYGKAMEGLLPLAEQGDATAQYRMARCLEFGAVDMKLAEAWYARAAEGSNTQAMCRSALFELARNPSGKFPASLVRAAELGDPDAKAWQGARLVEREETRKAGVALLIEAVSGGSAVAMARLSALYYLGEGGVKQDLGVSLRLMQEAVGKGFSDGIAPLEDIRHAYESAQAQAEDQKNLGTPSRTGKEATISSVRPGDGYPGRLDAYDVTPDLKKHLDRFNLTAGWYRRDPLAEGMLEPMQAGDLLANELPYLLFTPRRGQKAVPMVVYFGGTGEHGTNLMEQFRQTTVFSMITSPEFQKKHPCYLFAPMVPKGTYLRCDKAWSPPMADLVCDAMYAVVREANNPPVDTNRLYLTGLSYGGSAAYTFPFGYPGRFAASLPVAGYVTEHAVPDEKPGNFWLLCNEHEYASESMQQTLAAITRIIAERGGEHRASTFPDKGHNAWDKAWREEAVWEWMFSKTADGSPADQPTGPARPVAPQKRPAAFLEGAICTAAKPGRDGGTGPERAADGLEATCYVSAEPFKRGDWWRIDFAAPVSGRISVKSGSRDGSGRATSASVETSADGQAWTRAGRFSHDDGECRFVPNSPIKHLRVVSGSQTGETLILREVMVEE